MRVWRGLIGERYSCIIAFRRRSRTAGERVWGKLCPSGTQSLAGEGLGARGQAYYQDLRVCITDGRKYINECDVCPVHYLQAPNVSASISRGLSECHSPFTKRTSGSWERKRPVQLLELCESSYGALRNRDLASLSLCSHFSSVCCHSSPDPCSKLCLVYSATLSPTHFSVSSACPVA